MVHDPMTNGFFVTGTDTGVGKTLVAAGMLTGLTGLGYSAVGMKPVASGCRQTPQGLRNEDAETLQHCSSVQADYEDVNPYAFAPPVAPHLAADAAAVEIRIEVIRKHFERLRKQADRVVVEGIGGWAVPLNADCLVADLAQALGLPIVLVVGIRLGCLNHTLLTADAIHRTGLTLAGWVANCLDPAAPLFEENVGSLTQRVSAPLLGVIPYLQSVSPVRTAHYLEMQLIINS